MKRRDESDDPGGVGDLEGFDFDRVTARAWSRFQARLALHIVDMDDDDTLVIDVETTDEAEIGPYVQLCVDDGTAHLEASSNDYLTGPYRLSEAAEAALTQIGFTPPERAGDEATNAYGLANYACDADQLHADRLAAMAVRALRDVFDVPHPAFLRAEGQFIPVEEDEDPSLDDAMRPRVPRDRPHLMSLVDEALTPVFGHLPEHDEDDDIPVVSGSTLVFVRVLADHPTIELFASVVSDIGDGDRAPFEVSVLNRDSRYVRYVLVEDRILAYLHIPAYPFVPHQLTGLLAMMSQVIDRVDDDLAVRLHALRFTDERSDECSDDDEDVE